MEYVLNLLDSNLCQVLANLLLLDFTRYHFATTSRSCTHHPFNKAHKVSHYFSILNHEIQQFATYLFYTYLIPSCMYAQCHAAVAPQTNRGRKHPL